ncbi:MAG: Gfo/Idh/MocA family oxidoreductase [candidate division Zixibacteria bacterium]|nr:Gfo/Idh/MocA family oxidoreductase [candidate division Zixibacteria bacterium]
MIRIGQIGLGAWGKNLLRNFHALNDCQFVFAIDRDKNMLEKLGKSYPDIEFSEDVSVAFDKSKVDALIIATPPSSHFEFAKEALNSGLDVFIEKPMVLDVNEGEQLVKIASRKELILMVGHIMEYHPAADYLKHIINKGELGEIYYLYSSRVNLGKVREIENSLWSFAPHDISMMNYLLDSQPVRVSADGQSYIRDGIEDVAFMTLHYPNKIMAHVHVSWLDPHKDRMLTIVGSQKMVVFNDTESSEKIRIVDKGINISRDYNTYGEYLSLRSGDIVIPSLPNVEPLKTECQHFIDCVKSRTQPRSDGNDGLRVLKILSSAQKSLEQNGQPQIIK